MKYEYSYKKEDKIIFLETLKNIDKNKNITEILIHIFKKILSKQNEIVVVIKEDII
jgi:hypothetical protein